VKLISLIVAVSFVAFPQGVSAEELSKQNAQKAWQACVEATMGRIPDLSESSSVLKGEARFAVGTCATQRSAYVTVAGERAAKRLEGLLILRVYNDLRRQQRKLGICEAC
jgi:hypothetical protein